jgi:hypothetical protein
MPPHLMMAFFPLLPPRIVFRRSDCLTGAASEGDPHPLGTARHTLGIFVTGSADSFVAIARCRASDTSIILDTKGTPCELTSVRHDVRNKNHGDTMCYAMFIIQSRQSFQSVAWQALVSVSRPTARGPSAGTIPSGMSTIPLRPPGRPERPTSLAGFAGGLARFRYRSK